MDIMIFKNKEDEYLKWIQKNPLGFVVNTGNGNNSKYFELHKSSCSSISKASSHKKGAFTERGYRKICSNELSELINWFDRHYSKFEGNFQYCSLCNKSLQKNIKTPISLFPEVIKDETKINIEGAKKQTIVNSYERDIKARKKCLETFGYSCTVCKINLKDVYGEIGNNFIHVHHLKELSEIGEEYVINPIKDLRPVCPNCHAMLHQKKPCFIIEELKELIRKENT